MKRWIERALNIHPGDLGRGTLLCACLFLVITTYKIGGVAGPALFLSHFQARRLAYADISSALLVILGVAGYVRAARQVPFPRPLLGMVLFLLICTGLIVLIWRSGLVARGGSAEKTEESAEGGPKNLFGSMRVVFSSSYLRAIAGVICVGSLVTTLTGWQFLAIAQQTLQKKDALAAFFGDFNFYAGILSLAFQLLVTPRFLRRFGIGG